MSVKVKLRRSLVRLAEGIPGVLLRKIGNLVRELELRRWMKANGMSLDKVVSRREELFEMVGAEVGTIPVLYMEFGVAKGDATRMWAKLLRHPSTVLHGFDSFEGLPESWTADRPKGMFSTRGVVPAIDDPRVSFFKGWFQDTLPKYEPPRREVIVINMDADLYSSTLFALMALRHIFVKGTYLYFDEFSSSGHEERAFREFVDQTGLRFTLRGGTPNLLHVLFQCTGGDAPS
ncbi:MAG: TylF/MycF/NovP-related O-methyltransferase [Acidobacteriota bacterium]